MDFRPAGLFLGQGKFLIGFNLIIVQLGSIWDVLCTQTQQEWKIFLLIADFCQQLQLEQPLVLTDPLVVPAGAGRECPTPNLLNVFCPLNLLNRVHLKQP